MQPLVRIVPPPMIFWLAKACAEAREAAGRKQVHVAAAINVNESTIYRFEQGRKWPRDLASILTGYTDELGIPERELWERAVRLWRESEG